MAERTLPRPLSAFAAGLAASHKPKAMWAVLIEVDVAGVPRDVGLQALREQIIPSIKALPGFQPFARRFPRSLAQDAYRRARHLGGEPQPPQRHRLRKPTRGLEPLSPSLRAQAGGPRRPTCAYEIAANAWNRRIGESAVPIAQRTQRALQSVCGEFSGSRLRFRSS